MLNIYTGLPAKNVQKLWIRTVTKNRRGGEKVIYEAQRKWTKYLAGHTRLASHVRSRFRRVRDTCCCWYCMRAYLSEYGYSLSDRRTLLDVHHLELTDD